jgi:hypothetical protein
MSGIISAARTAGGIDHLIEMQAEIEENTMNVANTAADRMSDDAIDATRKLAGTGQVKPV